MIDNVLVWIPALVILAYIPILIYLDLKYREVEHSYWWYMVGFCSPCVAILYFMGVYPVLLLGLSLAAVGLYFVAMKLGLFEGADFMFLMFISLFFVQNPLSGLVLMPVSFGIFFITSTVATGIIVYMLNVARGKLIITFDLQNQSWDVWKTFQFEGGFPMMIPISAAFLITLVMA